MVSLLQAGIRNGKLQFFTKKEIRRNGNLPRSCCSLQDKFLFSIGRGQFPAGPLSATTPSPQPWCRQLLISPMSHVEIEYYTLDHGHTVHTTHTVTHRTRPALRSWKERQMRCFLMQPGGSCDIKATCRIACTGISLPPRSPRFAPNRQIWFVLIGPQ